MSVFDKLLTGMGLRDDGYDDDDYEEDDFEEYEEEKPRKKPFSKEDSQIEDFSKASKNSKIRQMPRRSNMTVCVLKPSSVEDAHEVTDTLLSNRTVVLNLEGLDVEIAQRIIDFTSGSCYAIKGNLQKVSNYIFIITPSNIDISGDYPEDLIGALAVPPINHE
ncbi:cell division inhibitor SepF [Acetitomaculum ruminis DSM 5522]|uniref:Cell division protein SepF n=1 Tax=Acetitomaculum ruminis DSM 5522 TaxID=1120918 RepID=A0A1I0V7X7_9FIRM|nr:cell division protein SepF [Acetitomaculum ruminis]SFA71656.1 cell division inhibitor SepF [Acetitomaculum ruminis DSM 5522]